PDKRREGGHGPTLADQVEHLLPTPQAFDAKFSEVGISAEAAERQMHRTDGYRRRTTGSLTKDLLMLPTPTARLGDDTGRGADPARYKGPRSLNGRRSNLDDCIAAVEAESPWLGEPTSPPSAAGSPSSAAPHQAQLSLDGPESG